MNKHQKAVYRVGEKRVRREEIEEYLELSRSDDPEERLEAAQHLCPCHVRRRIEAVWEALYRMLEDPDVRVRRAAWHTLEDGGRPDDPKLDEIIDRILREETDTRVRTFAAMVSGPRREKEKIMLKAAAVRAPKIKGRCDFCGEFDVFVEQDLDTMIPTHDLPRAAWICASCGQA
jgi:hypothetical protein